MLGDKRDRIEKRRRAAVRATLRDVRGSREICVVDISSRGLLATTARPPSRGEFIELSIGPNRLTGRVAWASERRFGIALRERVDVSALAEGGASKIELQRPARVRPRRTFSLAVFLADPMLLGKLGQVASFMVLIAGAGWLIFEFFGAAMMPVEAAVSNLN